MTSSNPCPKCVAEKIRPIAEYGEQKRWVCDTAIEDDGYLEQSDRCRGREEARAELLQWHTGEPPEGVQILINTGDGCIVLGIRRSNHMWVDGFGMFGWMPEYTWRKVQP